MSRTTATKTQREKLGPTVRETSSSVGRVFDVLDLFSLERPTLRVEDVSALLGYTRSTSYRYVRALANAGLVAPVGGSHYSLGARAVELDRLVQLTDPLLHAGQSIMPALAAQTPETAFLLCSLYGEKVLCIHHDGPLALEHRGRKVTISRPRGLPFSLFSGAASLAILANLPPYRIKALYLRHQNAIADTGLAPDWRTFRGMLSSIREKGYAYSSGTFNQHLAGIAAPLIARDTSDVLGSLTVVRSRDRFDDDHRDDVIKRLQTAAAQIAAAASGENGTTRQ